jgi:tetratricopeptide (TPR) repeat protein
MEGTLNDEISELRPEVAANAGRAAHQLHRMVKTLYESGKVDRAQELLRSGLPEMLDQRNQHPELELLTEKVILCYQLLGKTYRRQGDMDTAIRELQKAIDVCALAVQDPQVSLVVKNHQGSLYLEMASYLLQQHKFVDAATKCEQALNVLEPLYQLQPVGEIADMLEFAYSLTGNIFNRVDRHDDYLQLTDCLHGWNRLSPSVVKAKCHRIISHAHLSQWDRADTELARLVDAVAHEQQLLDVAGVCFKCAGMLAQDESSENSVYQAFVRQGLNVIGRMNNAGLLDDPAVVKLLREHDDFHVLREQDEYIKQFEP